MCYNALMRHGQTLVEYILVLVTLLGAAAAAGLLAKAIHAQTQRTDALLGSEYP